MSISQERLTNPSKFFIKLKSGKIVYYDKELQDNIEVPVPFEFIVLDQLASIKGWSDTDGSSYWSNEVRSISRDPVTIRTSRGIKESGIWKEVKGSIGISGARYNASIYIAHKSTDGGLVISNLSLTGAALGAWIEFNNKNRTNNIKVVLSGWSDGKKGAVSFKVPVFEPAKLSKTEKEEAIYLDKQLQAYLEDQLGAKTFSDQVPQDKVSTDFNDEDPISLEDIPF